MLSHWSWLNLSRDTPHAKIIFTVCVFIVAFFLLVKPKERAMLFAPLRSEHWSAIVGLAVVFIGFIGFTSIMGWDLNPPMTKTLQKVVIVESLANKSDASDDSDTDDSDAENDDIDNSDTDDDAAAPTSGPSTTGQCGQHNGKLEKCLSKQCAIVLCKNKAQAKCVKAKSDGSTFYEDDCEQDGDNDELFATFKKTKGTKGMWIKHRTLDSESDTSSLNTSTTQSNNGSTKSTSGLTDQTIGSDADSN